MDINVYYVYFIKYLHPSTKGVSIYKPPMRENCPPGGKSRTIITYHPHPPHLTPIDSW